jgi:hypothetical protein
MPLTQEYHLLSRTVILVIALSILIITIAGAFLFNFMKQLSSPSPGTEDISQPIDWSITQQYENYELNYEGMILERGVGVGNITKFLEKPVEIVYCKGCSSCTGIGLRTNTIPGTDIYNCSSCNTCNEVAQPNRFKNCWGCTNTTGLLNENCTLCDDTGEELQICKKLKACIYEHYADKSYKELHGCLITQIPFNESTSFDVVAFKNILKTCRSESIKINIGNNFSKEICYFNSSSISYYDFQRPSDFYLVNEGFNSNPGGTAAIACIQGFESGKELTPFREENGEFIENYRIYVAIEATPWVEDYYVYVGNWGESSPGVCSSPPTVLYKIGTIKTDANGFGYAIFDEFPQQWRDDIKNDPKKNKMTGIEAARMWNGTFGTLYVAFYTKNPGSNLEWTNDLRYSNCNFNTNIEAYLKNKPWWVDNDKLESSWKLTAGNQNSSIKVFYDSSMPAGGNSAQRGNLKIQLGRLDTDFLRECKFDIYACSQDAFAENEDDGILALSDFFTNFNPSNVYTTIDDGNKKIILYNYFEFNLDKPYDIEEIKSSIKTGFRLWETNRFLYDSSSTGLEWLKNNDGIYGASWTEISGRPGFNEDCWNSDVTNSVKSGNARVLIGNCPNNNCTEKLRIRVAFKYEKPTALHPYLYQLYPIITFCSYESQAIPPTPPKISCIQVAGGCDTNTPGGTHCAKYGSAQDCRCNNDWDIAAVQCPNGYKLIGGGCRCNNGGGYNGDSCPTNDISNAMTTTTCTDYNNPNAGYDWWFCDFDGGGSEEETSYATCCRII